MEFLSKTLFTVAGTAITVGEFLFAVAILVIGLVRTVCYAALVGIFFTFPAMLNIPLTALAIRSDLRFTIDERFREAGITIAFPQRDVHLASTGPLQLSLVKPEDDIA